MVWTRNCLAICLGLGFGGGLASCGDDGQPSQDDDGPTSGTPTSGSDGTADSTGVGPVDCVPGQLECTCPCMGGTFCVDDVCVLGPSINIGDDRSVVAGIVVPHEVEVEADEFSWSQESGPSVEIIGAQALNIEVAVPADAAPGDVIRLRLEASRNGVTLEETWDIQVIDDMFENVLPDIGDPLQLGTTEGLTFGPLGMYVVSTEGFVSLFNEDGEFVESFDLGGNPVGVNFMGEDLIIANAGLGSVQRVNSLSGNITELFGAAGQANYPLVDGNGDGGGDVYLSTRLDQTVLYYDGELDSTSVLLEDPGLINPNALAFGPENNTLYVGTQSHVWRVPLVDGGGAGTPEDYLDLGDDTCEVDGLVFDEGGNLWVGCPGNSTLYVAHYSGAGSTEISRSMASPAAGLSGFVNLRFGGNDFDGESLYYTNLGDGTVGRLRVGLGD